VRQRRVRPPLPHSRSKNGVASLAYGERARAEHLHTLLATTANKTSLLRKLISLAKAA